MGYNAGIDLGSTAVKVVIVENKEMIWRQARPTVPGQEALAMGMLEEGLKETRKKRSEIEKIAVTGYGKNLVKEAHTVIDELSANAKGAFLLSGGKARTVINIGGQDIKVMRFSPEGKLTDFKMNDKCAAGTGRFFEMAARILDVPVQDFGSLSEEAGEPANINSTCVVFAESEIVSLMAGGAETGQIIKGLHESVARRILSLTGSTSLEDDIYLDGGPANNSGLVSAIEDELFREVFVFPYCQFTVAYGAACSVLI
ncbi:MAG: hypothetical protein JW864_13705 [Spirochaetes bacterium]|nr:hypothetical protein [Spirochaetota bacterium]